MANSEFIPRKAQKSRVKLKMAIQGPSGSGKTEGALALGKHLVPDGRILLIDTENESASLYANRYDFDTIPLRPPYTSDRYKAAMQVATEQKYDVLIVDSITHQWDGLGGILRRKEELDRQPGSNSYTNWSRFTPEHTAFIEFIKQIPVHTIVTMRSKQEYVLEANDKGKQTPKKVGMAPIQRDGTEYEYTIVFDVDMGHKAIASKNRTTLFGNFEQVDLTDPGVAIGIREWLDDGEEPQSVAPPPAPPQRPAPQQNGQVAVISEAQAKRFWAIANNNEKSQDDVRRYLMDVCKVEKTAQMPKSMYEAACKWAEAPLPMPEPPEDFAQPENGKYFEDPALITDDDLPEELFK